MNARNIKLGIYGGLAGGVVFGAMMGAMGMLPMIGKMAGHPSAVTGFIVHLAISALIGASFAILFDCFVHGTGSGLGHGQLHAAASGFQLTPNPMPISNGISVNGPNNHQIPP